MSCSPQKCLHQNIANICTLAPALNACHCVQSAPFTYPRRPLCFGYKCAQQLLSIQPIRTPSKSSNNLRPLTYKPLLLLLLDLRRCHRSRHHSSFLACTAVSEAAAVAAIGTRGTCVACNPGRSRGPHLVVQLALAQVPAAEERSCDPAKDDSEDDDHNHDDILVVSLDPSSY